MLSNLLAASSEQEACHHVADHYIEYELVLIVLDIALHKIQAYRHILFNRRPYCDLSIVGVSKRTCLLETLARYLCESKLTCLFCIPCIQLLRVSCALILLDTHIKYAIYVHDMVPCTAWLSSPPSSASNASQEILSSALDPTDNPWDQIQVILWILLLSSLEFVAFTLTVVLASIVLGKAAYTKTTPASPAVSQPEVEPARKTSGGLSKFLETWQQEGMGFTIDKLLKAVLYPNFGRLLVVFVMIWDQQIIVAYIISVLVLTSQYKAIQAVMEPPSGFGSLQAQVKQVGGALAAGVACKAAIVLLSMSIQRPAGGTCLYML